MYRRRVPPLGERKRKVKRASEHARASTHKRKRKAERASTEGPVPPYRTPAFSMSSRFSLRLLVSASCIEWMSPSTTRKRYPISALPVTSLFQKPGILPYLLHFSTTTLHA